ncbi:hypothetical protein CDL15_Pgr004109 [Punica granatum]|uniref:Uncharacterized protein n=1 Tax=Punica granatum TaxID=22663 RepID=A0A218XG67_PUNGR|nr:hypothetical protein CDL15_Pgr004109 [Punica granatum]
MFRKAKRILNILRWFWEESTRGFSGNQKRSQVSKQKTDSTGPEQTRLVQVGSDVATEAPDGILRQGQWP